MSVAEVGRRDYGAYGFLAAMVLIGSSTATAAKLAVHDLPVGLLPIVRFGVAGLALLPVVVGRGALTRLFREDLGRMLLAAALCVPVNQAFFLNGTKLAPTTHVGLIYALCPLIVLGMAVGLRQERRVPGRLAGIAASVAGVLVIAVGNLLSGQSQGPGPLLGDALLLGAVASWAGYLTVNKPLVARHGALPVLASTFLIGTILDLPIAALSIGSWPRLMASAPASAWLGLFYLALVVSVCGLACQNQALRRLDASQVAAVGNAAPILTVIWGVWLLGEPFTPTLLLGGTLTLIGILWSGRPRPVRPVVVPARDRLQAVAA